MLSLPPHTSHKLQLLDLIFFRTLKTYYYHNIEQSLKAHPGRAVTVFQVCQIFGLAYGKAQLMLQLMASKKLRFVP